MPGAAHPPGWLGGLVATQPGDGSPGDTDSLRIDRGAAAGQRAEDGEARDRKRQDPRPAPSLRGIRPSPDWRYGVVKLTHAQPTGSVATVQPQRTGVTTAV